MKGNTSTLQRINYLIDQHVEIPYVACPGCEHCEEIRKISKEAGLWLGNQKTNRKIGEGKRRIKNFKKEDLKKYLDAGYSVKEICQKEKFTYNTVKRKIWEWYPEYYEKKKEDLIALDRFLTLQRKGVSIPKIAEMENVSYRKLFYQVQKWKNAGKLREEAIQSI